MTALALTFLGVDLTSFLGCLVSLSVGSISVLVFFAVLDQVLEAIMFNLSEFVNPSFYVTMGFLSFLDYLGLTYAWQNFFTTCPNIL